MMFSTKAEYGVRVMVALAQRTREERDGEEPVVPLAEIAERDGLPLAYLEHLVARLRKAGLIESRRGSRGGYMLARAASEITMAEVVEALEGTIAPIECITENPDGSVVCARESRRAGSDSKVCPTKLLWTRVRFSVVSTLMNTTLADLLSAETGTLAAMGADSGDTRFARIPKSASATGRRLPAPAPVIGEPLPTIA
jgi:Rrf2 family transcriptional regulator, cysteine metabolism repressor